MFGFASDVWLNLPNGGFNGGLPRYKVNHHLKQTQAYHMTQPKQCKVFVFGKSHKFTNFASSWIPPKMGDI